MSTIDQLAPATSASDTDEFIISQSGTTLKITRAQVLNGLQPQIAVPSGNLLGRVSAGTGTPEVISIGQNLLLNGTTLSATGAPFAINGLYGGVVPSSGDLVAMSQAGTNVAVTYGQLVSGMSAVPNIDLSQASVRPNGSSLPQTLAAFAANVVPLSGGTMTGPLGLAADPTIAGQAATKNYVDKSISAAVPLSGASMLGMLTLSSSPQSPLHSATKAYVDASALSSLPLAGGSLTGSLVLSNDPSVPLGASSKRYADQKITRAGDTMSGVLVLAADPVAAPQAATKNYVDTQMSGALSKAGGTLTGALMLASDPTMNAQAATKQYADQRLSRLGDTLTGMLGLSADPALPGQAATKNYVDTQVGGTLARSGSSMIGALLLASDPALPLQASTKQYADLKIARIGDSMIGAFYLAADPTAPLQAATKHYVDGQIATNVTKAGATFTGPLILASDPTSPTQAATKEYVDTRLVRTGDTLTGALTLAADPVASTQAATKNYVDTQILTCVPLSGGSISGLLTLGSAPALPYHAATKQYVDTQVTTALPLSGGTVTGLVSLTATPVAATHATNKQYVDGRVASALSVSGGTLTGALTLSGAPTLPLQAATKSYVDANPNSANVINVAMPPYGARMDGITDDTAAFKAAYLASPAGGVIYVPNGTTVLQQPGSWGIALTKFVKWIVDGTVLPNGTLLAAAIPNGGAPSSLVLPGTVIGNSRSGLTTSQGSSQPTDFALNQASYIVNHSGGTAGVVASNSRTDTIIYNSPGNYIWGGIDRMLWCGIQTPNAATAAQHVARYCQTVRQAATLGSNGQALPQPQLWAACLEYRDLSGQPSSVTNASLTVEMDWFGNGLDDANCRAIQSLVIGQTNTSGSPVEVANIIGVYLSGGSSGSAKTVFGVGVPFSTAVLDASYAQSINNAPVLKMAAGQAIAFEKTNSNTLSYNSSTNTLQWNQGTLSYTVGKGITVGPCDVYSSSTTLPNYIAGNLIILTGLASFTVNLPAASTVAAGTGFTFTATGTGVVSILPNGTDTIDCGPISLRQYDRYQIVSDGSSSWKEIFRTNAVSPRYTAPIILASYTVTSLPTGMTAGATAFATNGRKPSEAAGAGSGVTVFFDGQHWISSCSGITVAA